LYTSDAPLKIGTYASSDLKFIYAGEIAGIRIYPKALTASEVMQNYLADKNKFTETEP
jgi:hypothetical protein